MTEICRHIAATAERGFLHVLGSDSVRLAVVAFTVMIGALNLWAKEEPDPRARRVEAIKACTHNEESSCPHGRTWYVATRAPNASDESDGTENSPFKTINHAAQLALPGDRVLVAEGIYREHVYPGHSGYDLAHMISYVAKDRHRVVIKGSDVWEPKWHQAQFEGVEGTVWQAPLDPALFTYDFPVKDFNPFALGDRLSTTPEQLYELKRPSDRDDRFPLPVRGMIFMDGRPLHQADGGVGGGKGLVDFATASNVFFVPADGKSIYARFEQGNPGAHFFEITTREQVFAPRNLVGFIHVKGFVMEHGATAPSWVQCGMVSPNSIKEPGGWHWIIEDNIIRWSNAEGMDIGCGYWGARPGRSRIFNEKIGEEPDWEHWIRHNVISDNGQAGIWSIGGSFNSIIEYNRIERNGWKNTMHNSEAAGLKMHGAQGVVIRGNLVRDNDCFGIWLDLPHRNNRITQNLLIGNMEAGVFIEAGWPHTLVDNNIAAFTRNLVFLNQGDGFYNHQGSHTIFVHNLAFANAGYGYRCLMWGKGHGLAPDQHMRVSHNRVINNIAYANGRGAICLPLDQEHCKDNVSDYNFLWGTNEPPLFELGRAIMPPGQQMAAVQAAIRKAGVGNVGDIRHFAGPLVSLPVWQAAQGRDLHSAVSPLPRLWLTRAGQMEININIPEAEAAKYRHLSSVKCEPIPDIVCDYFGNPRPEDAAPTVGPFQDIRQLGHGKNMEFMRLWPLDPSRQLPAESLRLNYVYTDPGGSIPELDEQEKAAGKTY